MKISKYNPFTGTTNSMELDVTPEQLSNWQNGTLIQDAMPQLAPEEREFLITGFLPEEQADIFNDLG